MRACVRVCVRACVCVCACLYVAIVESFVRFLLFPFLIVCVSFLPFYICTNRRILFLHLHSMGEIYNNMSFVYFQHWCHYTTDGGCKHQLQHEITSNIIQDGLQTQTPNIRLCQSQPDRGYYMSV